MGGTSIQSVTRTEFPDFIAAQIREQCCIGSIWKVDRRVCDSEDPADDTHMIILRGEEKWRFFVKRIWSVFPETFDMHAGPGGADHVLTDVG